MTARCHWPLASSFTPGIVCGPAYGRDIIDRPARPCGFGRISQNLFGPLIAARRGFLRAFHAFHGSARGTSDLHQSFRSAVRHADEPTRGLEAWRTQNRGISHP